MNQPETDCCERLEWDSEFFEIGIGPGADKPPVPGDPGGHGSLVCGQCD